MKFSNIKLKILREQSRLTQTDAVNALKQYGIIRSGKSWGAWERGQNIPSLTILNAIAQIFNCKTEDLMEDKNNPSNKGDAMSEWKELYLEQKSIVKELKHRIEELERKLSEKTSP